LLLAVHTPLPDLARYVGYLLWAVLLPGILVYRALRRTPHSLLDDLATGTALGLVLEIAAYLLASVTGLRSVLPAWPLLVVVPFAAVPALRVHWRRPGYRHRVPAAWSWTVVGVALWYVAYLTDAFLRANQPVPVNRPQYYMIDQLWLMAITGDAKHHLPPANPGVGAEPLRYHWFAFAHTAVGSLISGVDVPMVMFRLGLPTLAVLAVALLALAGWRLTGRPWVGPVAAALMFMIGELAVPGRSPGTFGSILVYYGWSSPSITYGAVLLLPLLVLVADRLGSAGRDRGAWALVAIFALALPGAKSTELPVLLGGVGLVCLVRLVRRQPRRVPWLLGGVLLGSQLLNVAVLYRFDRQGVRLAPFSVLISVIGSPQSPPGLADAKLVLYGLGAYALGLGTRLAGVAALRRRDWGDTEWLLLGTLAAGAAGTLLLWHVSWSQHFFLIAGWPAGAVLSGYGLVRLAERYRLRTGTVTAAVAVALAVGLAVPRLLWPLDLTALPGYGRLPLPYRIPLPTYVLSAGVAVLAVAVAAGFALTRRRCGGFAGLCVLLAAGLWAMPWDARHDANLGTAYHVQVTPAQAAGARWLRAHSAVDDLVATNVHRVRPAPDSLPLSYWLPAFSERRVLLGSWGYAPRSVEWSAAHRRFGPAPRYWDPAQLAANDAAITDTTPQRLAWLRARGVRWIVVDRAYGGESPRLARLAILRWQRDGTAIYELPAAAPSPGTRPTG